MKSVLEVIELEQAQAKAELATPDPSIEEAVAAIDSNRIVYSSGGVWPGMAPLSRSAD